MLPGIFTICLGTDLSFCFNTKQAIYPQNIIKDEKEGRILIRYVTNLYRRIYD